MILCIGHTLNCCSECVADEQNKQCPAYREVVVFLVEVQNGKGSETEQSHQEHLQVAEKATRQGQTQDVFPERRFK